MAMGAVLAAALTDHSAHYAMLTVAGVDLLTQPVTGGTLLGSLVATPIESITAIERGPGQTSELSFTVDNPGSALLNVNRGDPVYFSQTASLYPIFQGFVNQIRLKHWGTGRQLEVHCIGLEAVLDWAKTPALTIPASTDACAAIQMVAASCVNGLAFPLTISAGGDNQGTLANPLGAGGTTAATALTIPAGTTLREAIRTIYDDSNWFGIAWTFLVTVDSGGRLRGFISYGLTPGDVLGPADWPVFYIRNNTGAPVNGDGSALGSEAVGQDFTYEIDGTMPAAVYAVGASSAVVVQDGSNQVGDTSFISDPNLDTLTRVRNAAYAFLGQNFIQVRGTVRLDSRTPVPTLRAGGMLSVRDDQANLADKRIRITQIERTFHGQLEDWQITFGAGGGGPSAVSEMRRLTRSTLS